MLNAQLAPGLIPQPNGLVKTQVWVCSQPHQHHPSLAGRSYKAESSSATLRDAAPPPEPPGPPCQESARALVQPLQLESKQAHQRRQ